MMLHRATPQMLASGLLWCLKTVRADFILKDFFFSYRQEPRSRKKKGEHAKKKRRKRGIQLFTTNYLALWP